MPRNVKKLNTPVKQPEVRGILVACPSMQQLVTITKSSLGFFIEPAKVIMTVACECGESHELVFFEDKT